MLIQNRPKDKHVINGPDSDSSPIADNVLLVHGTLTQHITVDGVSYDKPPCYR